MSRFNSFAVEVDAAIKDYFEKYKSAQKKVNDLKGKIEEAAKDQTREGQYNLAKLQVDLNVAQEAFTAVKRGNADVLRGINKTRENLKSEADRVFCADPSMIDPNVMKLFEYGILSVPEFEALSDKAAKEGNYTMVRLLAAAANEAAEGHFKNDRSAVQRLSMVSERANEYSTGAVLQSFDQIASVAKMAVGDPNSYSYTRTEPNEYFFDHWDEVAGAAIESF